MPEPEIRVRLAPSPTGEVHIGTMWIALMNWLFARQQGGSFILRIEDTDRQRLVPGSIERIYEALEWYDLTPDEGPRAGGSFGPYIQSERLAIYQQHARQLIDGQHAYYCFCSSERLDELRAAQTAAKQAPRYDKRCAVIPPAEAQARVDAGEAHVVRLNVPSTGSIVHTDIIRGQVTFALNQVDDSVLLKSDGWPTYHLAVVVDDTLMKISHVIRAEEWLPSVPKHLLLYRAFGWQPPAFAHLPLILGSDKSKLSKRHGATAALSFRDEGYLPEAMRNFLVLMGWHPKGDDEVLPNDRVLSEFRLADINPSGAVFDRTKLDWMNGVYIRSLDPAVLLERVRPFWQLINGGGESVEHLTAILMLVRDRMKRLTDVNELSRFVFAPAWDRELAAFDRALLVPKKGSADRTRELLAWARTWLEDAAEWNAAALREALLAAIKAQGSTNLEVLWPLRVALTLRASSPDVFEIAAVLGKAETIRRIEKVLA